jgi:hypothetical protein
VIGVPVVVVMTAAVPGDNTAGATPRCRPCFIRIWLIGSVTLSQNILLSFG